MCSQSLQTRTCITIPGASRTSMLPDPSEPAGTRATVPGAPRTRVLLYPSDSAGTHVYSPSLADSD
eukprot:2389665-Rhodomonas_salina.1